MPHHKPCLVVQGRSGEFYIDHDHPFGASCASSNAGMIANTLVDIWMAEGVKYEDDINIFPVPDGTLAESAHQYYYDRLKVLQRVSRLGVPWHPDKGDPFFSSMSISIGMLWDLGAHRVSLPEKKRLKFLRRVLSSFEGKHVSSVTSNESMDPSVTSPSFTSRVAIDFLPSPTLPLLSMAMNSFRDTPLGRSHRISSWGIGIIIGGKWLAFQLQPS
jgi:hypothetical protein